MNERTRRSILTLLSFDLRLKLKFVSHFGRLEKILANRSRKEEKERRSRKIQSRLAHLRDDVLQTIATFFRHIFDRLVPSEAAEKL